MSKNLLQVVGCYNPNLDQSTNGFIDCRYCQNFGPFRKELKAFPQKSCAEFRAKFGFIKTTKEAYNIWLQKECLKYKVKVG